MSTDGAAIRYDSFSLLGDPARRVVVDEPAAGDGRVAIALHDQVVGQRQVRGAADARPVLRHVGDAASHDGPGGSVGHGPAADEDLAPAGPEARHDLGQLALAVARHGGDPDDLARAHVERHVPQRRQSAVVLGRHALDREHDLARLERRLVDHLEDAPADHQPRQVGLRGPGRGHARRRHPAAAHDRDPVGDREDLAELVADEDDAPALGGHRPEGREQLVGLLRGEHRGRLVHDQDPGAAVEHLQDLDPLLLADRELPDPGAGVDLQAEPLRQLRRSPPPTSGRGGGTAAGRGRAGRSR